MPNGAKPPPDAPQKVQNQYIIDMLWSLDEKVDEICKTCVEREGRIRKLELKWAGLCGGSAIGGGGLVAGLGRALGWW